MSAEHGNGIPIKLKVALPMRGRENSSMDWILHPAFKGVFIKHLLTGDDTEGRLSLHLVKVEPGCFLAEHQHENQLELHEVLQGKGTCRLGEQSADYVPGTLAVIPVGSLHEVAANKQGLLLKATFTPALL
jgi:quercetin dioxygenase-like cupin family protein